MPLAFTALAVGALLGLAALTPRSVKALPPGFTASALARSQHATTHLVRLPLHALRQSAPASASRLAVHQAAPRIPHGGPVLAVGDSVMLGASTALTTAIGPGLRIDAVVSRQADATIDRLLAYRDEGTLPRRVIVHIGDNGPLYYAQLQRLKAALAGVPLVVLVNVRVNTNWQDEANSALREVVAHWRHATIADWYDASANPGTVVDGTHTSPQGAQLFAAVIARALHTPHLGGTTH